MDEAHERAPPPPPPLSGGQEDRPPPLPRALPEGEGQRFQEQARPHGIHPQEGGQEAQGGEAGAEEGRDAPELPEGGGAAGCGRGGSAEEVGGKKSWISLAFFPVASANRKINIHAIC